MSAKPLLVLSMLAIFFSSSTAKVYSKCDFANIIKSAGFPRDQWGTWTCIADRESHFDTTAINHETNDYGILQISSIYWCNEGDTAGKGCGITCKSLLVDDTSGSIKCARTVFDETAKGQSKNGFTAWTTYQYCQGDQSAFIKECNL